MEQLEQMEQYWGILCIQNNIITINKKVYIADFPEAGSLVPVPQKSSRIGSSSERTKGERHIKTKRL